MADQWGVTWERTAYTPTAGRNIPPRREQKLFADKREAVYFAMSLTDAEQQRARVHGPGSVIHYVDDIRGMYAMYQNE